MAILQLSEQLSASGLMRDRLVAKGLVFFLRHRGEDMVQELPSLEIASGEPESRSQLLTIGDIASRNLVARSPETDIYRKSVEQISKEISNRAELDILVRSVALPYEQLLISQAQKQKNRRGRGSWEYVDSTNAGRLRYVAKYGYVRSKKQTEISWASVEAISDFDDTSYAYGSPRLELEMSDNQVHNLKLNWKRKQPKVLMASQKGSPFGSFLGSVIPVGEKPKDVTSIAVNLTGQIPGIKVNASSNFTKDGSAYSHDLVSSFDYNPDTNLFERHMDNAGHHKGAKVDGLTKLTAADFALIVHGMLELFPSTDLTPIVQP